MRIFPAMLALALATWPACAAWRVIWSDEFDGPAGSAPDASKWNYDLGGGGWGNKELEVYTNQTDNVFLDGNGNLVIQAMNTQNGFTSARLKTQDRFNVQYGRIEARIKIPFGQGIWPAFWMLGSDIGTVGWPKCGEIDIMENIGKEPSIVHGSMHGPGYSGNTPLTAKYTLAGGKFSDDFHVYSIEWAPERVDFFVDGNKYYTVTQNDLPKGTTWVYDHPFFMLLNVAVGGTWPGNPDATSTFPQRMLVDWVRVWQYGPVAPPRRRR